MEQHNQDFFHDFRRSLIVDAEAGSTFRRTSFVEAVAKEIEDSGFIDGFEACHYVAKRGMCVDGFWFNDEGVLELFIADFESRGELETITQTEVLAIFNRVSNFFEACRYKKLFKEFEDTSPEWSLAKQIADRGDDDIRKVNFYLLSERVLSERLQNISDREVAGVSCSYRVWDISRLQRQQSSTRREEALDINFMEMFGINLPCLPAHLDSDTYQSYLVVIPGEVVSELYGRFGSRLLEQNVRAFLQHRGKVNKGIRTTILNESHMFFAYNNGITATAQEVETLPTEHGLQISRIKDLQIVNGGQTTASLFHTKRKDKASLKKIFVQMKLSIIPDDAGEIVVPKISEYANTQNRVNAADFFSNHPFHIRIEEFSRRIWAPALDGAQRETKWFYERARGQYADAQSNLTTSGQKRFRAEYPRLQMFTKTDLAKFENIWDDHPKWVNLGAQKNFAKFATRIGTEWTKHEPNFNEVYYKHAIARGIIFRKVERLVSEQPWYNGGYRANIVAYTLALINECTKRHKKAINFLAIWETQSISQCFMVALCEAAKFVNDDISNPPRGISNISEWCKKEDCWEGLKLKYNQFEKLLDRNFIDSLIFHEKQLQIKNDAKKIQKIDNGVEAQKIIFETGAGKWSTILKKEQALELLTPKEIAIVKIAAQMPRKIPSEKQSLVLLQILKKVYEEGVQI